MTKDTQKLNHALHNEAVCDYLDLRKEFADWIITTAFYTSLHFISYKVFPFKVPAIAGRHTVISNIDEYYRYKGEHKLSKHQMLANLTEQYCHEIAVDYDRLLDMSMNARYIQYTHPVEVANLARALMKKIRKFCTV